VGNEQPVTGMIPRGGGDLTSGPSIGNVPSLKDLSPLGAGEQGIEGPANVSNAPGRDFQSKYGDDIASDATRPTMVTSALRVWPSSFQALDAANVGAFACGQSRPCGRGGRSQP
jgi:hypothetical protein